MQRMIHFFASRFSSGLILLEYIKRLQALTLPVLARGTLHLRGALCTCAGHSALARGTLYLRGALCTCGGHSVLARGTAY